MDFYWNHKNSIIIIIYSVQNATGIMLGKMCCFFEVQKHIECIGSILKRRNSYSCHCNAISSYILRENRHKID